MGFLSDLRTAARAGWTEPDAERLLKDRYQIAPYSWADREYLRALCGEHGDAAVAAARYVRYAIMGDAAVSAGDLQRIVRGAARQVREGALSREEAEALYGVVGRALKRIET